MEKRSRILIADLNDDFRSVITDILNKNGSYDVIGSTGDGLYAADMAIIELVDRDVKAKGAKDLARVAAEKAAANEAAKAEASEGK